jgi:hypothetical protein
MWTGMEEELGTYSRRDFLLHLIPAIALAGCATAPIDVNDTFSEIKIGCSPTEDPRYELCGVGYSLAELKRIRAEAWQKEPQWCWAACIQMAFRFHGYEVSQERIVMDTYGRTVNLPAFSWQIHRQLSREWTDDTGRNFEVSSQNLIDWQQGIQGTALTGKQVQDELAGGRPLIIGTGGHAMLLVAQESIREVNNDRPATIRRATVIDPWPFRLDNNQFKTILAMDITMTQFMSSIEVVSAATTTDVPAR